MMCMCFQPIDAQSIKAIIPVKVTGTDEVTIEITSDDDQAIQALSNTQYEFTGEGNVEIYYSEPCDYTYTIKQVSKNDAKVTYDETIYEVEVFVENADGKLISHVAVWKQGDNQKKEAVEYTNVVRKNKSSKPTDTSDPNDLARSILLMLIPILIVVKLVTRIVRNDYELKPKSERNRKENKKETD